MDESQVVRVVDRINQHVCQQPWCDFEVKEYRGTKLVVTGSLDLSAAHIFEVWFEGVFFVSMPMEWKTDTSRPTLALMVGEGAASVNRRFRVERGHHIFRFTPEDYPEDFGCLVGAREIGFVAIDPQRAASDVQRRGPASPGSG
jgi:hypothetical protein